MLSLPMINSAAKVAREFVIFCIIQSVGFAGERFGATVSILSTLRYRHNERIKSGSCRWGLKTVVRAISISRPDESAQHTSRGSMWNTRGTQRTLLRPDTPDAPIYANLCTRYHKERSGRETETIGPTDHQPRRSTNRRLSRWQSTFNNMVQPDRTVILVSDVNFVPERSTEPPPFYQRPPRRLSTTVSGNARKSDASDWTRISWRVSSRRGLSGERLWEFSLKKLCNALYA